ncbi:MAG: pyridoxamine 5'-phosphate oxidase family protein [bacterium]|nr:pyridoxamine 5'-phosphate oxidase family protein [bacterium]
MVDDRARIEEMWQPAMKAWWPDEPQSPDITLITVQARRAEFWDASKGGRAVQAVSLVSALIRGMEAAYGENEKVEL